VLKLALIELTKGRQEFDILYAVQSDVFGHRTSIKDFERAPYAQVEQFPSFVLDALPVLLLPRSHSSVKLYTLRKTTYELFPRQTALLRGIFHKLDILDALQSDVEACVERIGIAAGIEETFGIIGDSRMSTNVLPFLPGVEKAALPGVWTSMR
jgi:hypothetical protein